MKHKKLFSSFVIMGIVPLALMTVFSYCNTSRIIDKKVSSSIKDNVNIMAKLIDSSVSNFESIANFIADNDDVKGILRKTNVSDYTERYNDINKIYKITNLILATQKLDLPIYLSGVHKFAFYTNMDYFSSLYQNLNNQVFRNADEAALLKKPYVYIHRRVDGRYRKDIVMGIVKQIKDISNDKVLGYVSLDIYDEYFDDAFKDVKAYSGDDIYVLNEYGIIVTDKIYKNLTGFQFNKKYLDRVLNSKSGAFRYSYKGKNYIAYFDTAQTSKLKIIDAVPEQVIYSDKRNIVLFFLIMLALFIGASVWMSYVLFTYISKPVNKLAELMDRFVKGDSSVRFNVKYDDEIGYLGASFNNMVRQIHKLLNEVYIEKYLRKDAEFKALKSQINPHFLYNILESINWMSKLGENENVSNMITMLGSLLRYTISNKADVVTVEEDVRQVENYITLQKMRYGDKFSSEILIDPAIRKAKILKLLIQPIVENAIVHGLEPKMGKGNLVINGRREGCNICFEIIDDGIGIGNDFRKGSGVGMQNVDKRIKIHYGDSYGLFIDDKSNKTCVKIVIPFSL